MTSYLQTSDACCVLRKGLLAIGDCPCYERPRVVTLTGTGWAVSAAGCLAMARAGVVALHQGVVLFHQALGLLVHSIPLAEGCKTYVGECEDGESQASQHQQCDGDGAHGLTNSIPHSFHNSIARGCLRPSMRQVTLPLIPARP